MVTHWSPPFETLQTHRGDCEDYAIVKYVALLQAGLSHDDVKIVILQNLLPEEDHAVVATRVDGQWLILDNAASHGCTIRRWLDSSQNSCSIRTARGASSVESSRAATKRQPIELGFTNKASVMNVHDVRLCCRSAIDGHLRGAEFKALVASSLLAAEAPRLKKNPGVRRGFSSKHLRLVTSGARRHLAIGVVLPVRRHRNITACGISIAVQQLLVCHRAALRSRVMAFGGSRRLRG